MTLKFSDDERVIVLRTLKGRLDALQGEMTQTDNPEFNIQLKHEEEIIRGLIERLASAVSRHKTRIARTGRRRRTVKRQR